MYFNVNVNGSSHLWRQRFPNGVPEQITFGPTEEEGLAVAPDGKSLITSIGVRQSSVWLHDATGDRRLPVEGSASQPTFSADGRRIYYLLQKANSAGSIELWVRDLASGKSDPVLTGQNIVDYDISPDQKNVVFTVRTGGGATSIFMAALDRGSAPHLLTKDGDNVTFAGAKDVVFRQLGEKAGYLARINTDGSGIEHVTETPIAGKMGASPDGEWVVGAGLTETSKLPGTYAISLRDGSRRDLCTGACLVKWSLDRKFLFLTPSRSTADDKNSASTSARTFVIPLPRGLGGVAIPKAGFNAASDQELNGIRVIGQEQVSPGVDANTYAYTAAEFQGNLFRIPLH
jgi:hypothetical protein